MQPDQPHQPQGHNPPPYPPGQYGGGQNPYPQQQYAQQPYPQQPYGQQPVKPPKRRRVWPWVLLALILVPVLGFAACAALVGGAAQSISDASKGGTVAIGQTFTYKSGLGVSVSAPAPYKPSNDFEVAAGEVAYEVTVTITNGTPSPVGSSLILTSATVNSAPAEEIYDGQVLPSQQIPVGQQLKVPFRFKVRKGTTGSLQVSVKDTFNDPAFFTGKLG
jgi:hypothetical protein